MSEVRFVDVSKAYDETVVIDHLSLSIADAEFAVLVGPSGCGKSTTLRMIAGLESITSGDLFIGERRVNDVAPKDRDIAMVFQSYALYPHMSVYDNLAFGLTLRKMPKDEIRRRVQEAAETLGIKAFLDRKPKALSGGQRQRVAMGRAIVRQPKVFLFDEPLSNLDAKLRGEMRREIARLHRETRTTVVYVTHDQVEAMTLADRIVVINRGDIMQAGTPLQLYERPANRFVAEFIGSPKMNLLPVEAGEAGRILTGEGFRMDVPPGFTVRPGSKVLAGARPSDTALVVGGSEGATCKGEVVMVEPLGAEAYVTLATPLGDVTVRQEGQGEAAVGDRLGIQFPAGRVHLFDAESGSSLRSGEAG